jgi:hypothetical protein
MGLVVAAVSFAAGASELAWAVQFALDESVGVLRHELVPAVVLAAVVLGGLRIAGVEPWPAATVALALGALYFGVNQIDLLRFSQDYAVIDRLHRIRYHVVLVAMPALGAVAALRLAPTTARESVAPRNHVV